MKAQTNRRHLVGRAGTGGAAGRLRHLIRVIAILGGQPFVPSGFAEDPGAAPKATPFPFTPPEPPKPPPEPVVRAISPGVYRVGEAITLEVEARTVRFPAVVNMDREPVEYFCVTEMGRTHEAVLRTTVVPSHLHVAVVLIAKRGEIPEPTSAEQQTALPAGCAVEVTVSWKTADGTEIAHPAARLILHSERARSPSDDLWLYTSSRIREGRYLADSGGDIIAIIENSDALVNIRDADRANDEVWAPNTDLLPEVGTPVEVTITLPAIRAAPDRPHGTKKDEDDEAEPTTATP